MRGAHHQAVGRALIGHLFIFPTHTQEGGYDMPRAEVDAFREKIIPGLAALSQ